MSSIKGLKTTKLSELVGRTITLRELRDDVVTLLTAFDTTSGEAFIISGEIKEGADQKVIEERVQSRKESVLRHTLQRTTRPDERSESTIERYDRTELMIIEHPYRLSIAVKRKNRKVRTTGIAQELNLSRSTVSLMLLVARERGYITVNEDKTYSFTDQFIELHPQAKEA